MTPKKTVFLDRDGVINRNKTNTYVDSWSKVRFLPRALKALRLLKKKGYRVVVVSNQAGVAKGFYSMRDLREITRRIRKRIQQHGGRLDAVYYCPHRDEDRCRCRKPKTELFRKAKERFKVRFRETYLVGDSMADIAAGKKLRCKTILVLSGREKRSRKAEWVVKPDAVKKDLLNAVRWILQEDNSR